MLRQLGGLIFAMLLLCANDASAQTSSVAVVPEPSVSGDTPPAPAEPLSISDIDYPFDSLIAGEEGDIMVVVAVDASGRATDSRLAGLSRFQLLNQQALRMAKQRWQFHPAMRNGMPVDGTVRLRFAWRVPLEPVNEFKLALPSPPSNEMPKPIAGADVVAADYPTSALSASQQGPVLVRYVIDESGNVAETEIVRSSGSVSLDAGARALVRRRKFAPAIEAGTWTAVVSFEIASVASDHSRLSCYSRPIDDAESERIRVSASVVSAEKRTPVQRIERWVHVDDTGNATDVLLATPKGLMRISRPIFEAMKQTGYPRQNGKACWYFDPIYVER